MPTKILKRLNQPARTIHVLLREMLVYALGWGDTYANPAGVFEAPLATGVDGQTIAATPNRFFSSSNPFLPLHVGKWLTVYGSEFVNNGVYQIVGVPNPGEVVLSGGLYGANFVDDLNVQFRVVDPTLNVGNTEFVVTALAGSAPPLWQVRFNVVNPITDTINFEVSPSAGWGAGWTVPFLASRAIQADAVQTWYVLIEDTHIRIWTQNAAGTGVFQLAYIGSCEGRRPSDDTRFVVSTGGTPVLGPGGALANISCLDASLTLPVTYSALTYGDFVNPNIFTALPASSYDLRNDAAKIAIGTDAVGFEEDDRGYLRGLRYISDQIPYRSFVDNGRQLLSLGGGLAFDWDSSLSR